LKISRDDYVSSIRNKLLAEAFYLTGDIEKYGTGFVRIRKILEDYPEVSYTIDEIGDFFRVELIFSLLSSDDLQKDLRKRFGPTENHVNILAAVERDGTITQQKLSKEIGITPKNIRLNMKKLKNKGLLTRIGPDKGGRWQVIVPGRETEGED